MPDVSVIMAVFNGERYVAEAIDSVLDQRDVDLELVVVDDGSTDATLRLARQAQARDPRVRVIAQRHTGSPAPPRNTALASIGGDFVCFLDYDDLWDPERTALLLAGLRAHPQWVAAFHDLRLVESDGRMWPGTYLSGPEFHSRAADHLRPLRDGWYDLGSRFYEYQSLHMGGMHTQSVMIARRRLPEDTLRFDETLHMSEDTDLWIRLALSGPVGFLDRVLSSYRQHDENLTRQTEKRQAAWLQMHTANFARVEARLDAEQRRRYRVKIAAGHADLAYERLRQGHPTDARAAYGDALRWRHSWSYASAYLKTFVPPTVMERLRALR